MNELSNPRTPVDSSVPSPARIWDYYIGGKDNYVRADVREVGVILAGASRTLDFDGEPQPSDVHFGYSGVARKP
ncbi:MAG TPA: SAM-dependent methyltransferase [Streptosporangiaceae bacterium]|nr:SAM-dependent methyltransferase [Streptosporangiaceae bacterium]